MRFKVGDVVVYARPRTARGLRHKGCEATILQVGLRAGERAVNGVVCAISADYLLDLPIGGCALLLAHDWQLDPKRPPQELGSWEDIQEAVGWSPVKTKENA